MKKNTPRHPKVKRLAKALKLKQFSAVGLLEMLWHYTAEFHPAGDIGLSSDQDIAEAVFWDKDPAKLVAALVSTRWLDQVESDARLLVHDWHVHAEDGVHLKLARSRKYFASGEVPKYGRLSGKERELADTFYVGEKAHDKRTTSARQAQQRPQDGHGKAGEGFLVSSDTENTSTRAKKEDPIESKLVEVAEKLHSRHPAVRRCVRSVLLDQLRAIVKRQPAADRVKVLDLIDKNHALMCATEQWQKEGGQYALGLHNWLAPTKNRYMEAPDESPPLFRGKRDTLSEDLARYQTFTGKGSG